MSTFGTSYPIPFQFFGFVDESGRIGNIPDWTSVNSDKFTYSGSGILILLFLVRKTILEARWSRLGLRVFAATDSIEALLAEPRGRQVDEAAAWAV